MSQSSLPRNYSYKAANFGKLEENSIFSNRQPPFHIQHFSSSASSRSSNAGSPRTDSFSRFYMTSANMGSIDASLPKDTVRDTSTKIRSRLGKRSIISTNLNESGEPYYSLRTNKELASIDKINDLQSNTLVCAGKTHLGLYKFSSRKKSISLIHDFLSNNPTSQPLLGRRMKQGKLSTIADVKTGFHNFKNYIAVSSNSTAISLYDVNKASNMENSLVASFQQHTRSINSFDFNMVHTNLIISGGQDSCIKIWDLRSHNSNKCEVNINSASDSIRDVKWMPYYNFASTPTGGSESSTDNSMGFKFASIHDSGSLLKYDMRQPNQVEKKINAHTGPGLCLNWHPNLNYIATGGRDGKLCLWYLGDKQSSTDNSSSTFTTNTTNIGGNASHLFLPELTINTGIPITKLKFKPTYVKNVVNSLFASSSMGEEAWVSIYSIARKYIPKHILVRPSPSLGLVWWDDSTIFSIDRSNYINGWNINEEPTLLDNLPKSKAIWRDIDGHGLLFLDQDVGGYEVSDTLLRGLNKKDKIVNQRMKLNNLIPNSPGPSNTRFLDSLKKGMSYSTLSNLGIERPNKPSFPYNSKSFSTVSAGSSHNNSAVSSPMAYSNSTDQQEYQNIPTPLLIPLNLPHVINDMRLSRFPSAKQILRTPEIMAIKESPIEVFQFLARELEFSSEDDKQIQEIKQSKGTTKTFDEKYKDDLMKRVGLGDMTTWTNLINNVKSETGDEQTKTLSDNGSQASASTESENKSNTDDEDIYNKDVIGSPLSKTTTKISKVTTTDAAFKTKTELLFKLVSICNHNASVYSFIDDLPNFKVWILIRDSLLWDLKWLCGSNFHSPFNEKDELNNMDTPSYIGLNSLDIADKKEGTLTSNFFLGDATSVLALEKDSNPNIDTGSQSTLLLNKKPSLFTDLSIKSGTPQSNLKKQILEERRRQETTKDNDVDLSKSSNDHINDTMDDSALVFDDTAIQTEQLDNFEFRSVTQGSQQKMSSSETVEGIPIIQKRNHRTSFIDTFMPDPRSMSDVIDTSVLSNSRTEILLGKSPINKHASFSDHKMNASKSIAILNKLSNRDGILSQSVDESAISRFQTNESTVDNVFAPEFMESLQSLKNIKTSYCDENQTLIPPWNTKKLLRQLFKQAVEIGNILLAINILTLFQNIYDVAEIGVVKDTFSQFLSLLHRYELFEIASAQLKYGPWYDLMDMDSRNDEFQIYCDKCGKLISNASSKERCTEEFQKTDDPKALERFGHWYCDACKKPNSLCVFCEKPMKKLTVVINECGHELHFACNKEWFLDAGMNECPAGCPSNLCI